MEHATWALKKDGCVGFFPTLITCPWQEMMDRLTHLKALTKKAPYFPIIFSGLAPEGPFLSPETGYRGAHDPQCMEDPKPEHLEHIRSITEADLVVLTLAPERKGSIAAFIRKAKKLGMRVSLGHTNADTQTLHEAFKAGAQALTHLGNACPQQLDRHDNILLRALDPPRWITGLIPMASTSVRLFFGACTAGFLTSRFTTPPMPWQQRDLLPVATISQDWKWRLAQTKSFASRPIQLRRIRSQADRWNPSGS